MFSRTPREEAPLLLDRGEYDSYTNKVGRSASIGALGGTQSLGTFQMKNPPNVKGLPKSYSINADGSPSYLTPTEMGRQELYRQIPFEAVFGLQQKERAVSQAFASYAAELDTLDQPGMTEAEKKSHVSRASMMILDELEFDANVVTMPLVFAVFVAAASQFLVGYNTGVMNAPSQVVSYAVVWMNLLYTVMFSVIAMHAFLSSPTPF